MSRKNTAARAIVEELPTPELEELGDEAQSSSDDNAFGTPSEPDWSALFDGNVDTSGMNELEPDEQGLTPPGFDIFSIKPETVQKFRDNGEDPTLRLVVVYYVRGRKKGPEYKRFRPEGMTYARLEAVLPDGTWDVAGFSSTRSYVGGKRMWVNRSGHLIDLSGEPSSIGAGGATNGDLANKLLYALAMRGLNGSESRGRASELDSAIASMMKMMTLNMQMSQLELKKRLEMMETEQGASRKSDSSMLAVIKTIFELSDRRSGRGGSSRAPSVKEMVGLMELGKQWADLARGKEEPTADSLKEWLLPLVDSIGPGAIAMLAMALPADKARMVNDTLEAHQKRREAEAKAEAGPDVVDAEGVGVDD